MWIHKLELRLQSVSLISRLEVPFSHWSFVFVLKQAVMQHNCIIVFSSWQSQTNLFFSTSSWNHETVSQHSSADTYAYIPLAVLQLEHTYVCVRLHYAVTMWHPCPRSRRRLWVKRCGLCVVLFFRVVTWKAFPLSRIVMIEGNSFGV